MKKLIYSSSTALLIFCCLISSFAQIATGDFDVRFVMNDYDCNNRELFIDIEVKANPAGDDFNMSDQNYRFSWNRSAVAEMNLIQFPNTNPSTEPMFIAQELWVQGFISLEGTNSLFTEHTMVGSIDTVGIVNVNLAGGDGYPLHNNQWVKVSRLRFVIKAGDVCLDLWWHTHDPADFPPTFIGQKLSGALVEAEEGTYGDFQMCFQPACPLPIELTYFEGKEVGCENVLEWQTLTETNNEYFILERSSDGDRYEVLGQIPGAGTSTEINSYSFVDPKITVDNYYRLTQVDSDGMKHQFETIFLKSECLQGILEDIIEVYPNPISSNERLNIEFFNNEGSANGAVVIKDVLGRIVDRTEIGLNEGPNRLTYDATNLISGTYFLQIERNSWTSDTKKFVKVD